MRSPFAPYQPPSRLYAPWYQRHPLLTAIGVLAGIAALVLGGLWLWPNDKPATRQQSEPAPAAVSTSSPATVVGVKQDSLAEVNNRAAVEAKQQYPEYYKCTTYPGDAELTQAALKPNANVVVSVKYSRNQGKYVASGDPRVHVSYQTKAETTSDGHIEYGLFSFTFDPGVRYFGTYAYSKAFVENQQVYTWQGTALQLWNPQVHDGWQLAVSNNDHDVVPEYAVLATDTRTCAAGSTPMPATLWQDVTGSGFTYGVPEYYLTHAGRPQG